MPETSRRSGRPGPRRSAMLAKPGGIPGAPPRRHGAAGGRFCRNFGLQFAYNLNPADEVGDPRVSEQQDLARPPGRRGVR